MGLKISKTYKGITCEYLRIMSYLSDTSVTNFNVGIYLNKEARGTDIRNMLDSQSFTMDGTDKTRENMYDYLKTLPEFDGASDI